MSNTLRIGFKEFEVKPLNLKALKKLAEKGYLQKLSKMDAGFLDAEQLEAVIQTVTIALQRTDKDVTADWIEENIEVQDIGGVLNSILIASGFGQPDQKKAESP